MEMFDSLEGVEWISMMIHFIHAQPETRLDDALFSLRHSFYQYCNYYRHERVNTTIIICIIKTSVLAQPNNLNNREYRTIATRIRKTQNEHQVQLTATSRRKTNSIPKIDKGKRRRRRRRRRRIEQNKTTA
jgi:hypothetical protein